MSGMTSVGWHDHDLAFSRHDLPELCIDVVPPTKREQGMPGARCTRGLACKVAQRNAHTSIQVQRRQSGIPCAMGLQLMPCSPWRRVRLVTIVGGLNGDRAWLGRSRLRQLDTSNGCQDHTVLPYALAPFVLRAVVRSRKTALRTNLSRRRCRVHRILSRVS